MVTRLLGIDPEGIVRLQGLRLRQAESAWMLVALLLLVAGCAAFLYWREGRLSVGKRVFLGACRVLVFAVLVFLLFEPVLDAEITVDLRRNVLVLVDTSQSMSIRDTRKEPDQLADAARALGKLPFETPGNPQALSGDSEGLGSTVQDFAAALTDKDKTQLMTASRLDLAKGILRHEQLRVFVQIAREHTVRYFRFGDDLVPLAEEQELSLQTLDRLEASAAATHLGSAVDRAVSRYAGQPIAAVILITDGGVNGGSNPLTVAESMKQRGIPLHTIGIGLPRPDDVRLRGLLIQNVVFARDRVPMRVQIHSNGYEKRTVLLTVHLDGSEVARKPVVLRGGAQFEELRFEVPEQSATRRLEVAVSALPGEATVENNRLEQSIRVVDEKIKVLYVEGSPRWEFRYLRAILKRDPRVEPSFITTEGDRDLARASKEHVSRFPEDKAEAFQYDLVILGDVDVETFTTAQMECIEELVRLRGGAFIMLAGHKHAPAEYLDTPVGRLLPVWARRGRWEEVDKDVYPVVAPDGRNSMVMSLETLESRNNAIWANIKPLNRIPPLGSPKPGAKVLASLSDSAQRIEPYPLITWHRYGSGKSMFIATDRLWRLRFKIGDEYHARFWGQAIQFLGLSRLLGENRRIRLETDRPAGRIGEPIRVYADVLDESYQPLQGPAHVVYVERLDGGGESAPLKLQPVPNIAGLYQGSYVPAQAGRYRLSAGAEDPNAANTVEFEITAASGEQRDTALQEALLRKMAEASGGRYFSIGDLPSLPEFVRGQTRAETIRKEIELWDVWMVPVLFLALVGIEWAVRRKNDLA